MAAFVNVCRFIAVAGGITDWVYSSTVGGCQSPAAAGAVAGQLYKVYAVSADLTQWEISEGVYATTGGGTFPRTTVLYNSAGTGTAPGQSGAGTKISFIAAPNVSIVALKEDVARSANQWTRTVFTSGSGTYTVPTGCRAINVRMVGGGGGGGGGGPGAGGGGGGSSTTFGSMSAGGGGAGGTAGTGTSTGVSSSGGDITIAGSLSNPSFGAGGYASGTGGTPGIAGPFGFGGPGGWQGGNGSAGPSNSGSGGGGGGGASNAGGGGGGCGGYVEKFISSPSATYTYAVGAGGTSGGTGTGQTGGQGGSGIIIIDEYY